MGEIVKVTDWPIEPGAQVVSKRSPLRIAIVNYRSVNGDVSYRIKGARRIYYSSEANFCRNWEPLSARGTDE